MGRPVTSLATPRWLECRRRALQLQRVSEGGGYAAPSIALLHRVRSSVGGAGYTLAQQLRRAQSCE